MKVFFKNLFKTVFFSYASFGIFTHLFLITCAVVAAIRTGTENKIFFFLISYILILISIKIFMYIFQLFYAVLFVRKYKLQASFKYIEDYINYADKNDIEFCSIFRPFGHDSELMLSSYKNYIFNSYYFIEEIIQDEFKKNGYETIMVRNPSQKINVRAVTHLKVKSVELWKEDVELLIQRSTYLAFIFPEKTPLTDSVFWEIKAAVRKGLSKRLIFFFPQNHINKEIEIRKIFEQLSCIFEGLLELMPDEYYKNLFMFYIKDEGIDYRRQVYFFSYQEEFELTDEAYRFQIRSFLEDRDLLIKKKKFFHKFPYYKRIKKPKRRSNISYLNNK